jgi:hypothetical protein
VDWSRIIGACKQSQTFHVQTRNTYVVDFSSPELRLTYSGHPRELQCEDQEKQHPKQTSSVHVTQFVCVIQQAKDDGKVTPERIGEL